MAIDVYVTGGKMYGTPYCQYQVFADGELYSEFTWNGPPLTWSQMDDVAAGYREGLSW